MKNWKEKGMQGVFLLAACASVLAVALICVFLFANGVPAMSEIGFLDFLLGEEWRPSNNIYGILPMIMGSIYVTAGAVVIGVPIGIFTSVFMAHYCPKKIYPFLKSATELLAGIPSVVYGFFGLVVIVPLIRTYTAKTGVGGNGQTMLTASIILGIMILPTIIGVTESAMRSVPDQYYEGSLALGATKERTVFRIVIPGCQIRCDRGNCSWNRTCDRRDYGGHHGCRKPAENATRASERCAYNDDKHCNGDGLCGGSAQRSTDCDCGGTVCIYFDYQWMCIRLNRRSRND